MEAGRRRTEAGWHHRRWADGGCMGGADGSGPMADGGGAARLEVGRRRAALVEQKIGG